MQIECWIAAVKGAKCEELLLYRKKFVCGIPDVKGANCVWDCSCKGSKLCVGLLLLREQIGCRVAALKG